MSCHDGIPASRKRLPPEWQDLQTARALGPGNKSRDDSLRQRLWTTAVPRPTFRGMTQQDGDYRDDPHEDFGEEAGSSLGRARRYAQVGTSVGGLAAQIDGARALRFGLAGGRPSSDLKAAPGSPTGAPLQAA